MKGSPKSTIRDVAAAAGVSLTTVSDALSGKGRLPEATRKKVQEAATRLDYRPSAIARGLRGQGLGLVGISIAPAKSATIFDGWYWAGIAMHASDALLSEGFAPVLLPHDLNSLQKLRIPLDGLIVVDPLEDDQVLAHFRSRGVKVVTIGYDPKHPQGPYIDDDNEAGFRELVENTVEPGQKVTVVTFGPRKSYYVDALRGLTAWASHSGSQVSERHCEDLDDRSVDKVLKSIRQAEVDVIVAQNDRVAMRLLARLNADGVRIPETFRLLSITDAPELLNASPTITSMRQHPGALGQLAAKTLFDLIRGIETAERRLLPMELVIRASAPAIRARRPLTKPDDEAA